jgi:DNA-binding transcriptional ArsR family regulator
MKSDSLLKCDVDFIHEELVRIARQDMFDVPSAGRAASLFQAMADPTRVRLISSLLNTELCVCDLAAALDMTQSAISHQLQLLRNLQMVKARREGRMIFYSLEDEHIRDFIMQAKEHIRHGENAYH